MPMRALGWDSFWLTGPTGTGLRDRVFHTGRDQGVHGTGPWDRPWSRIYVLIRMQSNVQLNVSAVHRVPVHRRRLGVPPRPTRAPTTPVPCTPSCSICLFHPAVFISHLTTHLSQHNSA